MHAPRRGKFVLVGALAGLLLALLPAAPALAVGTPSGLAPTGTSVAGIPTLSWNRVSGATSYNVQYGTDSGFDSGVTTVNTSNRQFVPTTRLSSGTIWWRVQASGNTGSGGWATSSFVSDPMAGPALLTPAEGTTLFQPDDPAYLSWAPIAGATSYSLEIDDSPDFITPVTRNDLRTTSLVMDNPQVATTYYWHVKAVFGSGVETTWSSDGSFVIGGMEPATLVSPADNDSVNIDDVVLKWEPVPSATSYELQVSTADSFTPLIDNTTLAGTTYSPSSTYANDQYYWRVRPVDAFGNKLAWDSVPTWHFKRAWTNQPTLLYPGAGATVGDPIYFQWTGVPLASQYTLQISTSVLFTGGTTSSCQTVNTTWVPRDGGSCWPGAAGTYYWRVFATDGPSNVSTEVDHAQVHTFSYLPAMVDDESMSPGGGDTVAPEAVTFSWEPVAGAASYRVYLMSTNGGGGGFSGASTTTTSYSPSSALTPGKTYKWFVQTYSQSGRPGATLVADGQSQFTVDAASAPTANTTPTPMSPANNATSVRFPKLTWQRVNLAAYYRVEMRNANGIAAFQDIGLSFTSTSGEDVNSSNLPGTYQWRVQAYDADNNKLGAPGPQRAFTIETPGGITGFKTAITGAASSSNGTSCTSTLPTRCVNMRTTPVFRWDPVPDAGSYRIWISNDATFTNIVNGYNGIQVDQNMFMPTSALPDSQASDAYYWQVVPCTYGEACTPRTDATHAVNKRANPVELLSPAANATGADSVTFTWRDFLATNLDSSPEHTDDTGVNAPLEARQYRVQVSTVPNFQSTIDDVTVDQKTYTAWTKFYPEGVLYWRVAAIDGSGNQLTFSSARPFTKATAAPEINQLNNGNPITQAVPFSWKPKPYASAYQVEIYKNADTVPSSVNLMARFDAQQSAVTLTSPLQPSSTAYTWRVRQRDSSGNWGPWSSLTQPHASFLVTSEVPVQTAPAAGVRFAGNAGFFSWTGVTGAANYRFERRLSGTNSLSEAVATKALAWAPTGTIGDGNWQWRVMAVNSVGADLGASPWRTFTVDATNPSVKATSPTNGKTAVKRAKNITISFSEPVTGVSATTIKLYRAGSKTAVRTKVTLNASKTVATVNPSASMVKLKRYTVKVSASIRDLSGNSLTAFSTSFTTGKK